MSVLNQKEKVTKGDCRRDFILITERTTKRGATELTLKRLFNNNRSFKLRSNQQGRVYEIPGS